MKLTKLFTGIALAFALVFQVNSQTATFNDNYNMGNLSDDWGFTGIGCGYPVVPSIISNAVYYITSAKSSGQPHFKNIWIKSDTLASSLDFYVAISSVQITNTWTNTGAALTNAFCISRTNGLGSGDVLVLRNTLTDNYQMLVASNSAYAPFIVYGYATNGVYGTATDSSRNDVIYKMRKVASLSPLANYSITNTILSPCGTWIPMEVEGIPIQFQGRLGMPSMVLLTYSNAASMIVNGEYQVRPRR